MKRLQDKSGFNTNEFLLEAQFGDIEGAIVKWVTAYDTNVTGTLGTMWNVGTKYPYNLGYGVDSDYLLLSSSAGASDAGVQLTIEGLDTNGYMISNTVALDGTGSAVTAGLFSRFHVCTTTGNTNFIGTMSITTSTGASVVAEMYPDDQRSMLGLYTIPKGYTGYFLGGSMSAAGGKEGTGRFSVRVPSKGVSTGIDGFVTLEKVPLFQAVAEFKRPFQYVEELTDIEIQVSVEVGTSEMGGAFGFVLLDNSVWGKHK